MVRSRAGRSSLGCLVTLLVVVALIYFGVKVGEVYWRAYQYEDAMKQEARFAAQIPNDRMLRHLRAFADTVGLPETASDNLQVTRAPDNHSIVIQTEYDELVEIPLTVRPIHFKPRVEATY
jgi:hypothetical protein